MTPIVALALAVGVASNAWGVTVERVADPRPGSWVVDRTGTLPAGVRGAIDEVGERVKAGGSELVVVVVDDVSGADPRRFATELGNRWGLDPGGALILVAIDDRAAEIVLGRRVDGAAEVRTAEEIMQGVMVPAFRAGRYGDGLLAGARAVEERILAAAGTASWSEREGPLPLEVPQQGVTAEPPRGLEGLADRLLPRTTSGRAWLGIWGLGIVGLVSGLLLLLRTPRCEACDSERVLLGEAEDDAHLSEPERLEERLGSVDHSIWACPSCGDALHVSRRRLFRRHKPCPSCGYATMSRVRSVLRAATSTREGLAEVVEDCEHCDHHAVSRHSIPCPSDDSDSFSSFSSSSGSSSSSSGGSFSSGSGASGRW